MDQLFQRLVENAIDFLARAVGELATHPKYSVVHFNTAVELFLKARLMHEHWSLIVNKRSEPDWEKFVAGDFQSVNLDEAANRLEKVVRSALTAQELSVFREVAKHRNKIVHFFHDAHSAEEGAKQVQDIAKQQLAAWYLLHHLLRARWRKVFTPWADQIAHVDVELRKHHEFLQIVFDQRAKEIQQRAGEGALFGTCPSCGYKAQQYEDELDKVYEAECLVCNLRQKCLRIECTECKSEVTFYGEGYAKCGSCEKEYEPSDLADVIEDEASAYMAVKDGDDSWTRGNCDECDGTETVVRTDGDTYVCTQCLGTFDSMNWCQWCNTPSTGDMDNSYYSGCSSCDGKAGWDADE